MIPHEILKEYVMNGVRFSYESYNHKNAIKEIEKMQAAMNNFNTVNSLWQLIPPEIRKKHIIWRTGKLWVLHFNKNGEMETFKIGRCPSYVKTFYLSDFGVIVKPMIFKSDDNHDLIGQGLAVEETL